MRRRRLSSYINEVLMHQQPPQATLESVQLSVLIFSLREITQRKNSTPQSWGMVFKCLDIAQFWGHLFKHEILIRINQLSVA